MAVVRDVHQPTMSSTTSVTVYILDANDHAPVWIVPSDFNTTSVVRVSSFTAVGTPVARIRAVDADAEANSRVTYHSIAAGDLHQVDAVAGDLHQDSTAAGDLHQANAVAGDLHQANAVPFDVDPDTGIIRLRVDLSSTV